MHNQVKSRPMSAGVSDQVFCFYVGISFIKCPFKWFPVNLKYYYFLFHVFGATSGWKDKGIKVKICHYDVAGVFSIWETLPVGLHLATQTQSYFCITRFSTSCFFLRNIKRYFILSNIRITISANYSRSYCYEKDWLYLSY